MMSRYPAVRAFGALVIALLAGCATGQPMTPQAREGVELRRHCEMNPQDTIKCLGFLGRH